MKQNEEIYIAEFDVEQPHTILVFKVLWLLMLLCYVEFSMNLLVLLVILFSGAQQFPINVTLLIEFVWISWSCLILAYFYCLIFILVADETSWSECEHQNLQSVMHLYCRLSSMVRYWRYLFVFSLQTSLVFFCMTAEAKVGIQHVGIMSSNMHQNNITSLSKVGEQFANGLQRKRIPVPSWLKLLILYVRF